VLPLLPALPPPVAPALPVEIPLMQLLTSLISFWQTFVSMLPLLQVSGDVARQERKVRKTDSHIGELDVDEAHSIAQLGSPMLGQTVANRMQT
jgi:hypothetical protein